ncbi:hypothetical protein V492_08375 [Pseudogymnoascus sp. VKM F-4246]|nr:hypothetical protein V492_08375 [Pseudogymnoascus sp. VKM F-4246]
MVIIMVREKFATTLSASLLVLALAAQDTSARFCDFTVYDARGYAVSDDHDPSSVSNQAEIDAKYGGCTEIKDNINIAANYTGRFYLPNVTTIDGGLFSTIIYHPNDSHYEFRPALSLTSIEVPDLNNTRKIEIRAVPRLKTISFPSMTVVDTSITLALDGTEDCHLDFPSLTTTQRLSIVGNMTSMNFPVLANAGRLRVSRNPPWDGYDGVPESTDLGIDRVDQIPLDISFPALRNASNVYLEGNISSLSMPRLSAIWKSDPWDYDRVLKIRTYGNPLNISLPSLSDVKYVEIAGTIGSLSFPSILSLDNFGLNTSTPLNVTLEPIKTVEFFSLYGNVTTVSMTSITKLEYVNIIGTASEFYCSSFTADLQRIMGSDYNEYAVHCQDGHPPKSKLPLILGLSIGLGVPVALALAYGLYRFCAIWDRPATPAVKREDTLPAYELGGRPPTYVAWGEGRGSDRGIEVARSVNADGVSESVEDATSARLRDGSNAPQEGDSARQDGTLEGSVADVDTGVWGFEGLA